MNNFQKVTLFYIGMVIAMLGAVVEQYEVFRGQPLPKNEIIYTYGPGAPMPPVPVPINNGPACINHRQC